MSISLSRALLERDLLLDRCERLLAAAGAADERRMAAQRAGSSRATEVPALRAETRRIVAIVDEKLEELKRRDDYISEFLEEQRAIAERAERHPYAPWYRAMYGANWAQIVDLRYVPGWWSL